MGVLSAALRRYVGHGPLHNFQQCLLNPLAGDVPGNGGIFALTGNLIDLIHIDDAVLRPLHIKVRGLQQTQKNVLHIIAHIAGLG